jgi:hypothetical protein
MYVPSYQMHNVLSVFCKQLRHSVTAANHGSSSGHLTANQVDYAPGGRREATVAKVSKDIFAKITRSGTINKNRDRITENAKAKRNPKAATSPIQKTKFVFNVINAINKKVTNTLSVEDSDFLIQRLEQLSKDGVDKTRESWVED